jgi:hypothetical protein
MKVMMSINKPVQPLASSFRDPSGFIFMQNEKLYRQVNLRYKLEYDHLLSSGLFEKLCQKGLLIPHQESQVAVQDSQGYKIIEPEQVHFISYPYEWSFSQLRDAALTTLRIQKISLAHGMSLKDSSAYNIQFHHGKPILIDTLSFEIYNEGEPWVAYRQFCQHFLAPLALMAKVDIQLGKLLRLYIDGVPLDLASKLLPVSSRLNLGLLTHIHLHAQAQTRYANKDVKITSKKNTMTQAALIGLIEHLEQTVKKLKWEPAGTEWADYYEITNYSDQAFEHKKTIILDWLGRISPKSVWDLGANNGEFTRLASSNSIQSISFDIDPAAIEKNYREIKKRKETNLLPLVMDLTNPSPAIGWHNQERDSLLARGPADMVFALALIHHLAISNNVPFDKIATFFSEAGKWLVVEFIPKSDSQVKKLLTNRIDIFDTYNLNDFEALFKSKYIIREKVQIKESERFLYLMERKTTQ